MTPDSLPGEEWRPIPGRERYEVSSLGRVCRTCRLMRQRRWRNPSPCDGRAS